MKHFVHFVPAERFFFFFSFTPGRLIAGETARLPLCITYNNVKHVEIKRPLTECPQTASLLLFLLLSVYVWCYVTDVGCGRHTHTDTLTQPFAVSSTSPSLCSHVLLTSFLQLFFVFPSSLNIAAALPAASSHLSFFLLLLLLLSVCLSTHLSVCLPPPPPPLKHTLGGIRPTHSTDGL